ncbi:hypothetical protein AB0M20_18115, partial [Actinoplanes sp. NPDC051633]
KVSYRWWSGDSTLDTGSLTFDRAETKFISIRAGRALSPGRYSNPKVSLAVTSPAGTTTKSITLELSCRSSGGNGDGDGNGSGTHPTTSPTTTPPPTEPTAPPTDEPTGPGDGG